MSDEEKDVPHLVIITKANEDGMEGFKLPEGGMLVIHESDTKKTAPMAVYKVTMKHIDLVCCCQKPHCNLRLRLRVEKAGHHPTEG